MNLETPLQYLKGVGPKMAAKLKKLDLETIEDLLLYYPRTWLDLSCENEISTLRIGDSAVINGKVVNLSLERSFKKRMSIIRAKIASRQGDLITAIWFNQPFLKNLLKINSQQIFYGKIDYDWQQKEKILLSPILEKKLSILAIYPETEGVTSRYLRRLIQTVLDSPISLEEFLPAEILSDNKLLAYSEAIKNIHQPNDNNALSRAKYRLAFNELFFLALKFLGIKNELKKQKAPSISARTEILVQLVKSLPYKLTNAQRKASWEIIEDMKKPYPMNRLLQGDVGSGKTIVALMAALNVIKNKFQVAWMAPTEILANQHYETACRLLRDFGVNTTLVTSNRVTSNQFDQIPKSEALSTKSETNSNVQNSRKLKSQEANKLILNSNLIIGTHALIQEGITFPNPGLVIIDEQHRFGVAQRARLANTKSETLNSKQISNRKSKIINQKSATKNVPHFLSMTATPIPRTLALSIYGDLDISVLNEMPHGRKKIITRLVDPVNRDKAYQFIRDQIKRGRQAFVICPLIETREHENTRTREQKNLFNIEKKSVKKEYEKLTKEIFPDLRIAMLHGRLKPVEKDKIMQGFRERKYNLIVSTSVVEVGVDIPNTTIMMIEDADRFGLSQLHQFRGRVGRGEHQSYCLLFTNSQSSETQKRLQALVDCHDGFKLAEKDLQLRGPGELTGVNQSGLPDLKMASLTDIMLIRKSRQEAEKIIAKGLEKYPLLKDKLEEFESSKHLE